MKTKPAFLFPFIAITLFLPGPGSIYPMSKTPDIEHNVTFSHKGTRSEAKHGHLIINGSEIPDVFTLVFTGERAYKFYQRTHLWGRDGYFPAKSAKIPEIKQSEAEISSESLKKGWYTGKEKLKGTPPCWVYVEWEGGNAFVSPDSIEKMAGALNLKKIQRWKTPPLRKNK